MDCTKIAKLLQGYYDNEVTAEEKQLITQHLESCAKCRKEYELLSALTGNLTNAFKQETAQVEPSPQAWAKISRQLNFGRANNMNNLITRFKGLFSRQPDWRLSIAGAFLVLLIITVTLMMPSPTEQTSYAEVAYFDPTNEISSNAFASIDDYNAFVTQHQSGGYDLYDYEIRGDVVTTISGSSAGEAIDNGLGIPVPEAAPTPAATGTHSSGGPASVDPDWDSGSAASQGEAKNSSVDEVGDLNYSETNVQVTGVDEADIIKTDGNYIYTVTEDILFIIKAYPGEEAEVVSTIDFDDNFPSGLFINNDNLAIFGNDYDIDLFDEIPFQPRYGMTFFDIYDISDRTNPLLVKEYKIEGNYFNSRMIDDWVYFVVRNQPVFRPDYPTPIILEGSAIRSIPVTDIHYFSIPYNYPQLVTIHSINIANIADDILSKSVAVEGGQNLYMSQQNMFITYTEYVDESEIRNEIIKDVLDSELTSADRALIDKIKATDEEILSEYEKENKIMQVYYSYLNYLPRDDQDLLWDEIEDRLAVKLEEFEFYEYTVINKIGVKNGQINVIGNGQVPGHIMNQFSLDEDTTSGVLRIATTVNSRWSRYGKLQWESTNNVYTLDSGLNIIGELEGLAESEQIYSTRFIGDKLYMVTFRQIDPFFVIDLSDPRNIRELGELKIPGFSRYLHPYDENTIIGIGKDATESGRTKGLKISLFDVSDFYNPKEIANWISDERYVDSTALYEHKAFLFSKEKELLVIPAYGQIWEGRHSDEYNGAMVFSITRDDIELRDLIDHGGWKMVERSLHIEDLLYTKSPELLKINEIDNLSLVKDVELEVR